MQVSFQCKKHTGAQKDGYLERQGGAGSSNPPCSNVLFVPTDIKPGIRDIGKEIMEVLVTSWRQKGTGESPSKLQT